MRRLLAVIACTGILFVFSIIKLAMGWHATGGFIPTLILLVALISTWRGITKSRDSETDRDHSGGQG